MKSQAWVGVTLVKIASLYLLVGLVLGMVMAIRHDFTLVSVHTHLGLLGWAAMAITGLAYLALPACAASRLAPSHFWLHNIGMPVMMASLWAVTMGQTQYEPVIGIGSTLVIAGLLLFTVNVLLHARGGARVPATAEQQRAPLPRNPVLPA